MNRNIAQSTGQWFARLGVAGFMFFFVKGLAWLAVLGAAHLAITG